MLKGHVEITLHNHNSGMKERIEGDNLITDAIKYIIPNWIGANNSPNSCVMPLCSRALGSIMLFDGQLEEKASNIFFPGKEAHFIAGAGQGTNTDRSDGGSYNASESYETDTGFVTTWDFSTSQANGSIQSLARTLCPNGNYVHPFYGFYDSSIHYARPLSQDTASCSLSPLCYDVKKQELYYIGITDGNKTSSEYISSERVYDYITEFAIYKEYIPTNLYGLADVANRRKQPEELARFSITRRGNSTNLAYYFFPGYDGKAYLVASYSNSTGDGKFEYWTISWDENYNFELADKKEVATRGCHLSNRWEVVSKGYAYIRSYDLKSIYIVNLANTVDIIQAVLPDEYILTTDTFVALNNGGIRFKCYKIVEGTTGTYEYHMGVCYQDSKIVVSPLKAYFSSSSYGSTSNSYTNPYALVTDNLMMYGRSGSGCTGYGYLPVNYLGSIFNLPSPVVKTAASSMKVVYTLTNVDE